MATYKLIQDIEAEDHILGPLTLRQFIFGLLGAFGWYLCFIMFIKHVYFLLVFFLPPALFCTFFAIPFGRDQPTEVWALAKLRFLFKPRRRLWDQSGVKELVTITVPKKVERVLTNGLSQTEVQSRLSALATTLDTRGWAVKNAALGGSFAQPNPLMTAADSDRLINIDNMPGEVPSYDVRASDDILDETSNPVAQQFETMINQSSRQHRQQLMNELNQVKAGQPLNQPASQAAPAADYWFMNQAANPANTMPQQVAIPGELPTAAPVQATAADDDALAAQLKLNSQVGAQNMSNAHLRTLQPLGSQPAAAPAASTPAPAAPAMTTPADPAILSLASNDDLNVSTLAREAYKATHDDEPPQDEEVVISLR
jgi:hypothetical protein